MEQNSPVKPVIDPSSQQFRQQLNQWFEQHGVLDNLRSHLRSVMITALQQTEFRLKPHQKTTPKMQSMNLLVAEYLLKHGCHYTLSILMSELPALANFASGAILFHCTAGEKSKSSEKYRFQENEVIEILNSLGMSSHDENLGVICESYNRNREEESLLECLMRFIPTVRPKRYGDVGESSACVGDSLKKNRGNSPSPRRYLSNISEMKLMRAVEEEKEKRMGELIERERRIQEYLKEHEEEVMQRLLLAEKDLDSRRETIDKELTERQMHLGRIAFQLKDKHNEIMELSKNFAAIKSENVTLRTKLDTAQDELNELREELEKKCEIIERLEVERMSMKRHVQKYLNWKRKGGGEFDGEAVTSNLHDDAENNLFKLNTEGKYHGKVSSSASSDESSWEEALLGRVKSRLELLHHENTRITEKYSKYKKKYEELEVEESITVTVREPPQDECVTVVEASTEPPELEKVCAKVDEVVEACRQALEESLDITPRKIMPVEEEKRVMVPTKRQQKNLEYYQQSRSLLEALEKSTGLVDESVSGSDISWSSGKVEVQGLMNLSDAECLTLLKEATHPVTEGPGG